MGVQHEFLQRYDDALISYSKAVDFATVYLGKENKITENVTEVFDAAKKQVENIQLKKWKRQQRKMNPVKREATYKELEEIERAANAQITPNYKNKNIKPKGGLPSQSRK